MGVDICIVPQTSTSGSQHSTHIGDAYPALFCQYLITLDITSIDSNKINTFMHRRDRIVVSTLRCGRNNPGSNPGHGMFITLPRE